MGHSCRKLLWDTLVGHSCGTLLWDTLVGHSCGILLSDTLKGHSCETLLGDTVVGHSCGTLLWDFQLHRLLRVLKLHYKVANARLHFARSTRTISAEGCAGTGQIALSPAFRALDTHDLRRGWCGRRINRTLACISRTRHARSPQRVARQVSKTSVSYETSSKLTRQSLQNERFVGDCFQKSSGNTHRSTHITQPCQAVSRFQPLQTTSAHTPIPM